MWTMKQEEEKICGKKLRQIIICYSFDNVSVRLIQMAHPKYPLNAFK